MDKSKAQARNRILIRAIDHYGEGSIGLRTIEALGECTQALARLRRSCVDKYGEDDVMDWIAESMAVTEISFEALRVIMPGLAGRVDEWVENKYRMLRQRLDIDDKSASAGGNEG